MPSCSLAEMAKDPGSQQIRKEVSHKKGSKSRSFLVDQLDSSWVSIKQLPLQSLSFCLQRLLLSIWILAAVQGPEGLMWLPGLAWRGRDFPGLTVSR